MGDGLFFDRRAEGYDAARPPYPDELWDRVRAHGVLRPGARLLEIGAGSGQATRVLVASGADVVAVEPGPRLGALLRRELPGVRVVGSSFEEADLGPDRFDAAVAATSLHWVDLAVGLPRLHGSLVPGGLLVAFRNSYGDPEVDTPFRNRVAAIVARRAPREPRPDELDVDGWMDSLTGSGWFEPVERRVFRWKVDLTSADVAALFGTFSNWSAAEVEQARAAVDELGGVVTEHYRSLLCVCRAVG